MATIDRLNNLKTSVAMLFVEIFQTTMSLNPFYHAAIAKAELDPCQPTIQPGSTSRRLRAQTIHRTPNSCSTVDKAKHIQLAIVRH
jgi:hypothetical protein